MKSIDIRGARTHNLRNLDLSLPREKLIVIDAVRGGQAPGTLYRFSPQEVEDGALPMNSLHQVGLLETLKLGELVDCKPQQTVVIGCQPQATGLGIGLSEEVSAQIEAATTLVRQEIDNYFAENIEEIR